MLYTNIIYVQACQNIALIHTKHLIKYITDQNTYVVIVIHVYLPNTKTLSSPNPNKVPCN